MDGFVKLINQALDCGCVYSRLRPWDEPGCQAQKGDSKGQANSIALPPRCATLQGGRVSKRAQDKYFHTHNHKVVASISLTALITRPILVPDVCAVELHVPLPLGLALLLGHATLGHVILLEGALREVWLRSPTDLRAAGILEGLTGLNSVQALFRIPRLVGAHIALQAGHKAHWKIRINLMIKCYSRCGTKRTTHLANTNKRRRWPPGLSPRISSSLAGTT